jgi:hypothetical protein
MRDTHLLVPKSAISLHVYDARFPTSQVTIPVLLGSLKAGVSEDWEMDSKPIFVAQVELTRRANAVNCTRPRKLQEIASDFVERYCSMDRAD